MLTTRFVNGAPNWLDVGTPDIDGAISFYGGLFGWQFQSAGPEAGGYGFFQLDGKTVAGGMQTTPGAGPAVLDRVLPERGRRSHRQGGRAGARHAC